MNPAFKRRDELWSKLFFQYWLDEIINAERYQLFRYFKKYYRNVEEILVFKEVDVKRKLDFEKRFYDDEEK